MLEEREADRTPPSTAEVNYSELYLHPPPRLHVIALNCLAHEQCYIQGLNIVMDWFAIVVGRNN
jgi:hypothetical protein